MHTKALHGGVHPGGCNENDTSVITSNSTRKERDVYEEELNSLCDDDGDGD